MRNLCWCPFDVIFDDLIDWANDFDINSMWVLGAAQLRKLFWCSFGCEFWELLNWEIDVDVHLMPFLLILLTEQMISMSILRSVLGGAGLRKWFRCPCWCQFWELQHWKSDFDVHVHVSFGIVLLDKVISMSISMSVFESYWLGKWFRCHFGELLGWQSDMSS